MAGKFVVNTGKDGKHYFRLKAGNGEIIFSSQGYAARKSCLNGIESVRKNAALADGRSYFVLKAINGQEIGRSQMYKSDSGCRNGMKSVAKNAADSAVVEEEA